MSDKPTLEELQARATEANLAVEQAETALKEARAGRRQEGVAILAAAVAEIQTALSKAESVADDFGLSFDFGPTYGMGGTYYGTGGDWDSSTEGWESSSNSC